MQTLRRMHGCGWACASALRQQCGFVKCTPGGHTEQYQGEFLLKAWQGDAGAFVLLRQNRKSLVTEMVSWHKAAQEGQTGSETGCDMKRLKLEQWAETRLSPQARREVDCIQSGSHWCISVATLLGSLC